MGEKKYVLIDNEVEDFMKNLSKSVIRKFIANFRILGKIGWLKYPISKKLTSDIYEIRVKINGNWRALYGYTGNMIVILTMFKKKSQKTPRKEILRAENKLKLYRSNYGK